MPGAPQREPVRHENPDVQNLLLHRYALYWLHRVSLGQLARALNPAGTIDEQRNLAAKIGRFFRNGSGPSTERWNYLETEIRLAFPDAEQPGRIHTCAALYRRAFPNATDCWYRGDASLELPFADYVRRSVEDSMRLLGERAETGDLTEDDIAFIHGRLAPLLDRHSLFNPCLQGLPLLRAVPPDARTLAQIHAMTTCDQQIEELEKALRPLPLRAARRLRDLILDHRATHQRIIAGVNRTPATTTHHDDTSSNTDTFHAQPDAGHDQYPPQRRTDIHSVAASAQPQPRHRPCPPPAHTPDP